MVERNHGKMYVIRRVYRPFLNVLKDKIRRERWQRKLSKRLSTETLLGTDKYYGGDGLPDWITRYHFYYLDYCIGYYICCFIQH